MEFKKVTADSDPRIEFWMRREGPGDAWAHAVGPEDKTRNVSHEWDSRCLTCHFGHAHTLAYHARAILRFEEEDGVLLPPESSSGGHDCRCLCGTLFPCEDPECLAVSEHEATCPECLARERSEA